MIVLDNVFKIVNFLVFIGFVVFYVRKNLYGLIQNYLLRRKAEYSDLLNQGQVATTEHEALQGQLIYHEETFKTLEDKVEMWRSAVHTDHEQQKHQYERFEHELQVRMKLQIEYWKSISMSRCIIPQAFNKAYNELHNHFQNEQYISKYNDQAIEHLIKSE